MAVQLLAGLAKGLLSQGARKATTGALKKTAIDKAKQFLKNKKDKKSKKDEVSTERGGALIRAMSDGGVSAIVKSPPLKVEEPRLETEGNKIGFEKITLKIDNIAKISGSIDDALKGQFNEELERRKKRKAALARLRRRKREKLLESGKKALGTAGFISGIKKSFNIMDFITNIILGGLLLLIVKSIKKIIDALNFVRKNAYIVFASLRAVFQAFKLFGSKILQFLKGTIKGIPNIISKGFSKFFGKIKPLFKTAGSFISSGLRKIGDALYKFGAGAVKRIKDLAKEVGSGLKTGFQAAKNLAKFLSKTAPVAKLRGALAQGGKFLKKSFVTPTTNLAKRLGQTRVGNKLVETAFDARLGIRQAKKALAPVVSDGIDIAKTGITKGKDLLVKGGQKGREVATAVKGKVSPFLRKFLGEKTAKEAAGAAPFLKKLKGPLSKIKIPILGPTIELAVNLLDPEVSAGEAIFKALGTGIGEVVGTLIPIPILGTMLGGILGSYGGSLLYSLLNGGGIKEVQERISADFAKALDVGKQGWEFLSGGATRLIENFPEKEIPNKFFLQETLGLMFPLIGSLQGKGFGARIESLPDIGALFDMEKMGNLLKSSFFPDGFQMPSLTTPEPVSIEDELNSLIPEQEAAIYAQDDMIPDRITPIGTPNIDSSDADLFQRLVLAESQGEGKLGMAIVARSVMNRVGLIQNGTVTKGTFLANDNTLRGVIYGPKQYQPVSDGSIDRSYSDAAKQSAQAAIDLAKDPDALRAALIGSGVSENQANILLASTGFRTASAYYDASQDVNVVKYKNHLFNTAGNITLKSVQPIRDSAMPTKVTSTPTSDIMGGVKNPQETDGASASANPPEINNISSTSNLTEKDTSTGVVAKTDGTTQQSSTTAQISKPTSVAGTSVASSPVVRNLEQYPTYESGNQNIIIMENSQPPVSNLPPMKNSSPTIIRSSTTNVLNSYYKKQLLGLLYKVG